MEGTSGGLRSCRGRWKTKKKKTKKKKSFCHSRDHTFFPILISSCCSLNAPYARKKIDRLLRSHIAFVRSGGGGTAVLPPGLLSLLPLLLNEKRNGAVAALAAEMAGAIALCSLEANEEIAADGATVRALVAALSSRSEAVAKAACHAILDLSAAPLAREQLRKSFAVQKLLSVLSQVAAESASCDLETGRTEAMFPSPFLDAAVILINTCDDRFLESIAGSNSTRRFLPLAREIWLRCRNERKPSASPSMPELAEFIFRLSMNQDFFTRCPPDLLRKSFFGGEQSDFENFIFSYWENSPILLKNGRKEEDAISSCCNFTGSDSVDSALESILSGSVSCPPLISDELDILSFLEEVNGSLGSDMVNGQDIRVVKTLDLGSGSKKEVVLTGEEIRSKCRDAVKSGYTVALRGLEFRSMGMAGLSDGLAALFGQPSVGVNVYLTPPGSQGLSRHYDDHCVFVCQLQGTKRWVVSPMSSPLLPRLYEQLRSSSGIESGGGCGGEKEFLLHRGDVLYIPRGCVHEASTTGNGRESWADTSVFSLHLTLGIEVEPPFEWEGVAHVALHCWSQNQRENCLRLAINLLHIAIGLVGDGDPLLRKASLLLASSPLSSKANPNGYFFAIIASIEAHSSFTQALEKAEAALKKDASVSLFFHRLRWLRHLSPAGVDFDCASEAFRGIPLTSDQMASLEEEFSKTKLQFCACADLEDSKRSLEMLSRRYRKVRRQYMNGMLALQPPGG